MGQPLRGENRAQKDKEWMRVCQENLSRPPAQIRKGLNIQTRVTLDSRDLISSESKEGALW